MKPVLIASSEVARDFESSRERTGRFQRALEWRAWVPFPELRRTRRIRAISDRICLKHNGT